MPPRRPKSEENSGPLSTHQINKYLRLRLAENSDGSGSGSVDHAGGNENSDGSASESSGDDGKHARVERLAERIVAQLGPCSASHISGCRTAYFL